MPKSLPALLFLFSILLLSTGLSAEDKKLGAYLGAKSTEYPAWFKDSFLDFAGDIEEAAENNKRVLLIFHQNNCPYCAELVEQNLSQKNIEAKIKKHFDVVALNMWGDREVVSVAGENFTEKSFAAALKVQFTPTLLFFTEEAKLALRLNGYLAPDKFEQALDYVAAKTEKTQSFREYLAINQKKGGKGGFNKASYFNQITDLKRGADSKPLAVFFEQKDCPNCNALHQKTLQQDDTLELLKSFDSVQLDMWSDNKIVTPEGKTLPVRDWAEALKVQYAPTIILFNAQGEEVIRSEAFFKSFHTQSIFDYVLSDGYQHEPSFQRWISERAEIVRETGRDVNIWE